MLRVSNLTRNVSEAVLREICGNYGSVKTVEFICFPGTKKLKGVAYVGYDQEQEANTALEYLAGRKASEEIQEESKVEEEPSKRDKMH